MASDHDNGNHNATTSGNAGLNDTANNTARAAADDTAGSIDPRAKPAFEQPQTAGGRMLKSHPLGMAIGAVIGLLVGLVIGFVAGPLGSIMGAVVGAGVGALLGAGGRPSAGSKP